MVSYVPRTRRRFVDAATTNVKPYHSADGVVRRSVGRDDRQHYRFYARHVEHYGLGLADFTFLQRSLEKLCVRAFLRVCFRVQSRINETRGARNKYSAANANVSLGPCAIPRHYYYTAGVDFMNRTSDQRQNETITDKVCIHTTLGIKR